MLVKLRIPVLVAIFMALIGTQSMNAMNSNDAKMTDVDVRALAKSDLHELTKSLDSNLKALLELFWYDAKEERCKQLIKAISNDLAKLVGFMEKDAFDWHPELVQKICDEVKKQLNFSKNSSQSQRESHIITAWRMKNHLFELFNQERTKNYFYLDCFNFVKEVSDNRSLDAVLKEYNKYKSDFVGIDSTKVFFNDFDGKITDFKKEKKLFEKEIKEVEKSETFNFIISDIRWGVSHYILPILNVGFLSMPERFKEKENEQIKKQDIEWQVTYLKNKITHLETELQKPLVQGLQKLKNEIKAFKPLADTTMLPHKIFLNNIIELARKECKRTTVYDSLSNYNPKKITQNFIGNNLLKLDKPLKNVQGYLGKKSIEKNIDARVKCLIDTLLDVHTADELMHKMGKPFFDFVIGIVEKILSSDDFRTKLCDNAEYYFPDRNIKKFICNLHSAKKQCNDMCLSLVETISLIQLIGNDRLGILLKTVMRMVANDSKKSKEFLGKTLYKLVKTIQNSFNYLEKSNQSLCYNLFWNAKTKADDIYLLSYLAQANKKVMKVNKNNSPLLDKVINNKEKSNLRNKTMIIKYSLKKKINSKELARQYEDHQNNQKEAFDSYKKDEKRLMIRILQENDWNKKQALELELSTIRKRMNTPSSNKLINTTQTRYNELMKLQKKD